jgi:hypothetical protein
MSEKKGHALWTAESDTEGNVVLHRSVAERDDLDLAESEFIKSGAAAAWGLWGASVADRSGFDSLEMPISVCKRFNLVAKELQKEEQAPPRVRSWAELSKVLGQDKVLELRHAIANGMEVRLASKFVNLPFVVTADLLDDIKVIGKKAMKEIVDFVKTGKVAEAVTRFGKVASKVADFYSEALETGNYKIAVDEAAKAYWEAYYGDFGAQLVKEIKKRVRADIAYEWLVKHGVDQAAAEYWQNYFAEMGYGKALTEVLPKKLSPSKNKEE